MVDFSFSVLWIRYEINRLKETVSTIEAVLQDVERSRKSEDLDIWLKQLVVVLKNASELLNEIEFELRSQGSAGQKFCRFFSSSNPLVLCFRIGHRIKKMIERIDKILAERDRVIVVLQPKPKSEMPVRRDTWDGAVYRRRPKLQDVDDVVERIETISREIIARIDNFLCFGDIGRDDERGKPIVYVVACIVAVCLDPFFLYIPFLSLSKKCLGMNRMLWKVAVALRTAADFFTALILFMSIDRPQLSRCMSSIKLILLMCVKCLVFAPIPQILLSEKLILKTLGGYTFWNLILFCHYGARLVLIFQACEQLKTRVSVGTLVRSNAPVYLFLYLIVSHAIGASWYYLSIKRILSCWNYACKNITGCIFPCDGTTPSTLNSTLVIEFCPPNLQKFGLYLDALESGIVEDKGVLKKFLQCFFWGLRNLSSFASNLHTSANDGETFFAIIISAVALVLLINILASISFQRYSELESASSEGIVNKLESARSESIVNKMEPVKELIECLVIFHNLDNHTKKSIVVHIQQAFENGYKSFNLERLRINHFLNDVTKTESVLKDLRFLEEWVFNGQPDNLGKAKKWLSDNNIPHDQNNIFFYLTCRLRHDEDVNLTSVLSVLPDKSKWWMTMKDLCFDTLKRVPGLQNIDEEWFTSMSNILKPVIFPKGIFIFQQGEPLEFIIFITNGVAWGFDFKTIPDARGHPNCSFCLRKGDCFGAELIKWKLGFSGSSKSLGKGDLFGEELEESILKLGRAPISTADVKSHTQVEAFVLTIEDLDLISDFPVESRSALPAGPHSATERFGSSNRTEEGSSI